MKKYIIITLIILLMPLVVFAGGSSDDTPDEGLKNKCEGSSTGCAFCVYSYVEDTGCNAKFSVTYKSGNIPLEYETYSSGSNTGYVSCTFSYSNFIKNDFVDSNGNIICPNGGVKSEITSSSGRTAYKKVTFSSDASGALLPTGESKIVNVPTNNTETITPEETFICQYGEIFTVSIIDENINIVLNGYEDFTISKSIDINKFKDKNCPDLYYYANTRGSKVFSIHDEYPMGYYTKISGTLVDENTGNVVPETSLEDIKAQHNDMHYSIINYNNLCGNSSVSSAMMLVGYLIEIAKWIAPLIIIVLGMIDFGKASISSDDAALKNSTSSLIRRFIAGISIFFVITIVDVFSDIILETDIASGAFASCTDCMLDPKDCSERIVLMKEEETKIRQQYLAEKEKIEQEWREQQQQQTTPGQTGSTTTPANPSGNITYIDTTDLGCTLYYEPAKGTIIKQLGFDSSEANNVHNALKSACGFINSYDFVSYLQTAGAYVNREGGPHDYHRVGLAVDLNNQYVYTSPATGKTYRPYSYQGESVWNDYKKFICDVCGGKENCVYNINYQIYERYFKNIGWCWGGNWGPKSFDPMHFEKRTDGGCLTSNKKTITCS